MAPLPLLNVASGLQRYRIDPATGAAGTRSQDLAIRRSLMLR